MVFTKDEKIFLKKLIDERLGKIKEKIEDKAVKDFLTETIEKRFEQISNDEKFKSFLRKIVEEKLKEFEETANDEIFTEGPQLLSIETKYDEFMKNVLKKLE